MQRCDQHMMENSTNPLLKIIPFLCLCISALQFPVIYSVYQLYNDTLFAREQQ